MPDKRDQRTEPEASGADSRRHAGQAQPYEIPPEGSLGLLAMGAVGITEWRYARERAKREADEAAAGGEGDHGSGSDGGEASEDE